MVFGSVMTGRPFSDRRNAFFCVPPADADNRVQTVSPAVGQNHVAHVANAPLDLQAVGLDAAGAENRAADRENAGEGMPVQWKSTVLDQPEKAVANADGLDAATEHGLPDATNRGVQSGAVPSGSQDADPLDALQCVPCILATGLTLPYGLPPRRSIAPRGRVSAATA